MNNQGGMGICSVLGIVFIVLKLIGVIAWSWWWVLSPFWIPLCIFVTVVAFTALIIGTIEAFSNDK